MTKPVPPPTHLRDARLHKALEHAPDAHAAAPAAIREAILRQARQARQARQQGGPGHRGPAEAQLLRPRFSAGQPGQSVPRESAEGGPRGDSGELVGDDDDDGALRRGGVCEGFRGLDNESLYVSEFL